MMEFTYNGMVRHGFGFYNPNHAAAMLCVFIPFLWGWKRYMVIGLGLSLFLTVLLTITFSRTGVIVLIWELIAFILLSKGQDWKLMTGIGVGAVIIIVTAGVFSRFHLDKAVTNRPEIWLAGMKLIGKNPQGVGLGHSGIIVSSFLLDGITCRTLVNAHLTLLAECGILVGSLWLFFIFYALLQGSSRPRSWCAFSGLCLSACNATIFDLSILTDFQDWGNLSLTNFILSWLLMLLFFSIGDYLIWGKLSGKKLICALFVSSLAVMFPLCFRDARTPQVHDGMVVSSLDAPLVLYDDTWSLNTVLPYCHDGFRIPLKPTLCMVDAKKVMLFGKAAEYADSFPNSALVIVYPPEFFIPPPNTEKIIVSGHDIRTWMFPVERE